MNPIFPSILSCHFYELETKLRSFASLGIEAIHLDVMDGHFVPNLSFGPAMVRNIKALHPFLVDAHLMVSNPIEVVPWFIKAGADWISVHVEISRQVKDCLFMIKEAGVRAGLVINPDTEIQDLYPLLHFCDYVLLMSVFPGQGGQTFIPETLARIRNVKTEIDNQKVKCLLQVDGGINHSNIEAIADSGADLFVVGSALSGAVNSKEYLEKLMLAFGEQK